MKTLSHSLSRSLSLLFLLLSAPALADRAASESAVREGDAAVVAKDLAKAIDFYDRAVEADHDFGTAWGKRGIAKYRAAAYTGALEDLAVAVSLEPNTKDWRFWRTQAYLYLDRVVEALEESEALAKAVPEDLDAMSLHGRALIRAGDIDGGIALQQKAFDLGHCDPQLPVRTDGYQRQADWKKMREVAEQAQKAGALSTILFFHRVVACVEAADFAGAQAALDELAAKSPNGQTTMLCRLYLESSPGAGDRFKPAAADQDAIDILASSSGADAVNVAARARFLAGRPADALDLLESRGRRANFETMFWLGAANWKLGRLAEARAALQDARRYNPYLAKHASRVEGFGDFVSMVDKELAGENAQPERGKLGRELAVHLLTVAEIEALVRRYRFARAADEYAMVLKSLKSEARRKEVEERLPQVKGMAGALAKLVAAINAAKVKLKTTVGKTELTIAKATDEVFEFTIAGGQGRFPWAFLDPGVFCDFAVQTNLGADEIFGLGCLAWDAGLRERASVLFAEAWKSKPALKTSITAFIARRRGLAAPDDGFTWFRGQYATKEEKANLEKGLLPWQGGWVPAKDREQLAKGNVLVDGKWLPGIEADLLKKGFRKLDGKWVTAEAWEEFHQKWENAWTEETAHYSIRTNESEAFAKDLASVVEPAYEAFRKYHDGAEPKLGSKEKMTLYAYRTYDDYRRWCIEQKAEDRLAAAGYATSTSLIVVGWNKTANRPQFLQTMVHEAAHLYYMRLAPGAKDPSWFAEGMATYFEGFEWDGKIWKFGAVPESRLPRIRSAMQDEKQIPLAELFKGDALTLINNDAQKALLFYSECWALNYYLTETSNKAYRAAWAEYRKAIAAGRDEPLGKFLPDLTQFEKDWVRFVTGL
ncbi:MAG: DUF1570 domain-containing protein [Planctomycetes bacterium]|nr:DUF1570 domain-containing protein [Planctomycetota bacterium]